MYKEYFRLNEMPFSIAPDPRFLFMSERHCEAMAHLLYGVQGDGGIVLLTGDVGTGKTTICRSLIDQIPDNVDVAFILNPCMSAEELLKTICEELNIAVDYARPSIKTYIDALNVRLLSAHTQNRRVILIVDEAQNLDSKVLEQLRLLTNLETNTRKLLQIFLIGQPELLSMLDRPEMRQVSQRVVARYHLTHLNQSEVAHYVAHRLSISGASPLIFPKSLVKHLFRASRGVPRIINLICDRALLGAYVQRSEQITQPILGEAVKEVLPSNTRLLRLKSILTILLILFSGAVFMYAAQLLYSKYTNTQSVFDSLLSKSTSYPKLTIAASEPFLANGTAQISSVSLKVPNYISIGNSESLAYQSLFLLYGLHLDTHSDQAPCQQAENQGMRCYAGHGGLPDLIQIDQPVLMRLSSVDGKRYWATLMSLEHQTANIQVQGVKMRVPLSELAGSWYGQFVAIWESPPDFNGRIMLNDHGPTVTWIRHRMELIDGIRDNGSDLFDEKIANRVRAFQLSDGIQPDGLVGPLTMMRLNVRSGMAKPHLVTGMKG